MKKIAFVGAGDLATAFIDSYKNDYDFTVYSRPETDISSEDSCRELTGQLIQFDVIIITAGVFNHDFWQSWLVNTVGPAFIINQLIENNFKGKAIVVSSNGANWDSWPGIPQFRLLYNNTKQSISRFVKCVAQSDVEGCYVVFEPSAFQSKMSNGTGWEIQTVAKNLKFCVDNSVYICTLPKYNTQ
jgi:hypothetical protein